MMTVEGLGVHICLAVATCATNVLFICTVGRKRRLRTTTNLILLSMAVADLFVGILFAPSIGFLPLLGVGLKHDYICACVHSIVLYFVIVSLFHVVLVAVERYLCFVYPLRYPIIFTYTRLYKSIALCWIAPLFVTISPAIGWYQDWNKPTIYGNMSQNGTQMIYQTIDRHMNNCEVKHIITCSFTYFVAGIVTIVFVTMTYFHLRILFVTFRQLRKHRQPQHRCSSGQKPVCKMFRKDLRAFFLVMFVVDYFLVSWSPVAVLVFLGCVMDDSTIPEWMYKVFPMMAMTNSTFNPIVYGLAKRDIRRYVFGKFCKKREKYSFQLNKPTIIPAKERKL